MAKQRQSLGATLGAMGREAVKDVRQTVHEGWFGKPEHAPEMGTPMNPTPQMLTAELTQGQQPDGYDAHLTQAAEAAKSEPAMEMDHDRE